MAAHVEDAVHRGLVADLTLLRPRVLAAAAAEKTKYILLLRYYHKYSALVPAFISSSEGKSPGSLGLALADVVAGPGARRHGGRGGGGLHRVREREQVAVILLARGLGILHPGMAHLKLELQTIYGFSQSQRSAFPFKTLLRN